MPTQPDKGRRARKQPPAKPTEDGFVVYEVDGFAQLTPEQRTWPIVETGIPDPKPNETDEQVSKP